MKPICITFAGTPGSQKSPVAVYLSHELGLPIFEHDAIRDEVQVDTMQRQVPEQEYYARRDARRRKILERGQSFIYDASQDRAWPKLKPMLERHGYRWFLINLQPSKELMERIQNNKGRTLPEDATRWFREHREFLAKHTDDIGLTIDDENFADRNTLALAAARKFLEQKKKLSR